MQRIIINKCSYLYFKRLVSNYLAKVKVIDICAIFFTTVNKLSDI